MFIDTGLVTQHHKRNGLFKLARFSVLIDGVNCLIGTSDNVRVFGKINLIRIERYDIDIVGRYRFVSDTVCYRPNKKAGCVSIPVNRFSVPKHRTRRIIIGAFEQVVLNRVKRCVQIAEIRGYIIIFNDADNRSNSCVSHSITSSIDNRTPAY